MALNADHTTYPSLHRTVPNQDRHLQDDVDDRDAGRSNFAAFLLGGVMIAGGMLAFLYYDSDNLGRGGDIPTGSIARTELQGAPSVPNAQVPMRPPTPVGTR